MIAKRYQICCLDLRHIRGAAHIDGLYVLAQEMMKHIKKLERKK
jgi:hypothetical protein